MACFVVLVKAPCILDNLIVNCFVIVHAHNALTEDNFISTEGDPRTDELLIAALKICDPHDGCQARGLHGGPIAQSTPCARMFESNNGRWRGPLAQGGERTAPPKLLAWYLRWQMNRSCSCGRLCSRRVQLSSGSGPNSV